jgi:hypothetical protein
VIGFPEAFSIRLSDGAELSIDADAVRGPADSGDLATDLAGLFVELGQGGIPAGQVGHRSQPHPGRAVEKGAVLLPPLGRDRLHRAHVRHLLEAVDPDLGAVAGS